MKTPEQIKQSKIALTEMLKRQHEVFCSEKECQKCKKFVTIINKLETSK